MVNHRLRQLVCKLPRRRNADSGMRIENITAFLINSRDGFECKLVIGARRGENLPRHAELAPA